MLEIRGGLGTARGPSRREWFRIGVSGLAGSGLSEVLRARQARAATRKETSVILFWMAGGPSQLETYDMKPDAPAEVRGPFRPIPTKLPGWDVCELMPGHARVADRLTVIRSFRHHLSVHDDASHWVQTGYPLVGARDRGQQQPSQGATASALLGPRRAGLPAYVCIPEAYSARLGFYQGAAFLGARHGPVNAGGDPRLGRYRAPEFALPGGLTLPRLESRRALMRRLDRWERVAETAAALGAMDEMQQRAFELVSGPKARAAFDLAREPARLHDAYGRHAWGQAALLARRLAEAGVTFITINLYEKDVDWWDDHTRIEQNMRKRVPVFDQALSALVEDLDARGMSGRVLVVACGEFGRAPRVDRQGGRGHWPGAMSVVLSGGGIKAGQVIGATDRDASAVRDRPFGPGDLLASIDRVLGLDPSHTLRDREGRPLRLAGDGEPIAELF
jgi:hypothetical protein